MSNTEQLPVKVKAQEPLNITTIMIVIALLLFAVGLAYSQGWLNWSSSNIELESNKVGASQTIAPETTQEQAVQVTQNTADPANTATE